MNKEILQQEISFLLETIQEQIIFAFKNEDRIPQIELDILKANIRDLYDKFLFIEKTYRDMDLKKETITLNPKLKYTKPSFDINKAETPVEKPIEPLIEIKFEPIEPITSETTEKVQGKEDLSVPTMQENLINIEDNVIKENIDNNIQDDIHKQKSKKEEQTSNDDKTKKPSHPNISTGDLFSGISTLTLGDTLKQEKQTIHDKLALSNKEDKSVASKLQNNPISDIKKAIGINEKFQFINELCKGNIQDYNEIINSLNNFSSKDEALEYYQQLKEKYSWSDDLESAKTLLDIIIRRYSL
jgi:hypothetical protein